MRQILRNLTLGLTALMMLVSLPVLAQETEEIEPQGSFTGGFQIGIRGVSVDGSENKYKQHVNLEDGPVLFNLHFDYLPEDVLRKYVDKVEVDIYDFGVEPYETFRLAIEKFGRYKFSLDRRESNYFYHDTILPVEDAGDPALALAGDFHTFDFRRSQDHANLEIRASEHAKFNFGFFRYVREGESTTTLDISRDEFELDQPIDEELIEYRGGFEYDWSKVTLILEGRVRDFDNAVHIFLPGQSLGEDPEDATILDYFFLDRPYDYTAETYTAKVVARPTKRLLLRFAGTGEGLDLDSVARERSKGISFAGEPFEEDFGGTGEITRDLELYDLDLTYDFGSRFALLAGWRSYTLDQDGQHGFGEANNLGSWEIDTQGFDIALQFALNPGLMFSAGWMDESRDVDHGASGEGAIEIERETTDNTGWFLTANWRPGKNFRLDARYEDSSIDNPFSLISPTDREMARLKAQYNFSNAWYVSGSYQATEMDNTINEYSSSFDQADLRFGFTSERLAFSAGYNNIDIERKVDQVVTTAPGFGGGVVLPIFNIQYLSDADFLDARVRWVALDRLIVGGLLNLYDNSGSFGVQRDFYKIWGEFAVTSRYWLHLGYRDTDYDEEKFDFDDYSAEIVEFSVGYRW